jgi:hypothetical protein
MNPKYRVLYLLLGAVGFVLLAYQIIGNLPDINPEKVLLISLPDMLFFYLAYKTYPAEEVASVRS